MQATQTAPQGKDTASPGELFVSFELADKTWKLTIGDGRRGPSRYTVGAGDTVAVLECLTKARTRCNLSAQCKVHSCYEAGRDGWWLHRWLIEQGIDNIVVDAASIEVSRRARRAKTDRLDGDKLLAMLLRHHAGERVWSVLREPSAEAEDARRTHRELARLMHERIAHTNRIGSLLVLHNLRAHIIIGGRDWAAWWERHSTQVPPMLRAEIERESARLKLVKEVFGWREFANRRELAGCVGLAPTPYASGDSEIEQGISKAGNRRVRSLLVEQSWSWLKLQPDSALTQWFNRRFAGGGKRMRRVGIVALARRLVIALWRYLKHGEIPAGAVLKPAAA